ncbi:MAG TPA: acyltransferase [Candidatus Angelobacter sp.]|nr:acyltransferase [Candidatus Angelobacter sp.]
MDAISNLILNVKRGTTPLHRFLRKAMGRFYRPQIPPLPGLLRPPLRFFYELHYLIVVALRSLITICYRLPIFQARCEKVGKNLSIDGLPFVSGHVKIEIGDNVWLGGKVAVLSGKMLDDPTLIIGDYAELGWNVLVTVNRLVVIEEHVRVSYDCRITDSDAHPQEADLRAMNHPARPEDCRPVRICKYAWIGNGTHIMKGVTIGEGAIVGANSVVMTDVPPYCLAVGNPARVYLKDFGLPSTAKDQPESPNVSANATQAPTTP